MILNHQDYEAIAALTFGTLEDWAYDLSEKIANVDDRSIMGSVQFEVAVAIGNMMNSREV